MKIATLFTALFLGLFVFQAVADARPLRKNETYCHEVPMSGGDGGGGTFMDCSYETLAQCNISRMGVGGWCMLNPVIQFEQRRNRQHRYRDD